MSEFQIFVPRNLSVVSYHFRLIQHKASSPRSAFGFGWDSSGRAKRAPRPITEPSATASSTPTRSRGSPLSRCSAEQLSAKQSSAEQNGAGRCNAPPCTAAPGSAMQRRAGCCDAQQAPRGGRKTAGRRAEVARRGTACPLPGAAAPRGRG